MGTESEAFGGLTLGHNRSLWWLTSVRHDPHLTITPELEPVGQCG